MTYKLFRITNIEGCVEQDLVAAPTREEAEAVNLTSGINIVEEMTFEGAKLWLGTLQKRLQYIEYYLAALEEKAKAAKS